SSLGMMNVVGGSILRRSGRGSAGLFERPAAGAGQVPASGRVDRSESSEDHGITKAQAGQAPTRSEAQAARTAQAPAPTWTRRRAGSRDRAGRTREDVGGPGGLRGAVHGAGRHG